MPISEKTSQPTKAAVREEVEIEAFLEKVHQMGHSVERTSLPIIEPRDWETEKVMDMWVGKYTRNIALHYHDILASQHIGPLAGLLGGAHPVAIVGAGPSLDKNAELLRDFPGLIIACDGAAIPLTARGILPDIVIAVDPRQSVIAEMLDYPESQRQILALSAYAAPDIAAVWHGKKFYFSTTHEGIQFYDRILPALFPGMPALFATGNVGNTAVQMASWLGAGKVVLVGQDYGYTGGRFRCSPWAREPSGIWHKVKDAKNDEALNKRTGKEVVDGVETYGAFVKYRETLNLIVKAMKLDIVNATEGGILTGIPAAKLADVITDLRSQNHQADAAHDLLAKATGGKP